MIKTAGGTAAGYVLNDRAGAADTKKIVEDYIASLNRYADTLKAVMKR